MYPASRLAPRDSRSGVVARLLSLVAVLVLMVATLEIFSVLKPEHPYLVDRGAVVDTCPVYFGGREPPGSPPARRPVCHLVVPDQKVPLRVGVGLGAIAVVVALMAGASRQPESAPAGS
jgi:hypothetical protein